MRIGLISNLRGGLRQFAFSLSEGLKQKGFRVEILCPGQLGLTNTSTSSGGLERIRFGPDAIARSFTKKYDLLHCNIATFGLAPAVRSITHRLPLVETFHGFPQWWLEPGVSQKLQYVMEHNMLRFVARSARSCVSVSHFIRHVLQQRFGVDSLVIHHGIDRKYSYGPTRAELRGQYGITDDDIAILFVGRLHPYKDPSTLLRAFSSVAKHRPKLKLFVVGDGPLSRVLQTKVRELGLENSVMRWPHVSNALLHSIYSATDIFCLPSINEAFGYVLLEAMNHGIPTLVSASGASPEIIGESGLVYKTGDDKDLADKLLRLVDDPQLRRRLGARGRERVEAHFSINRMVDGYVHAYEQALSRHQ